MTLDDDLFNVPENDEEILDANEEDEDEDEDEEMNDNEKRGQEEEANEDQDEDDEDEDDDDDDNDEEKNEDEDEDDDEEEEEEGDEDEDDDGSDDGDNADESKYIDAKETQNEHDTSTVNANDNGNTGETNKEGVDPENQKAKEDLLEQFRDDLREEEEKERIKDEEGKEIRDSKENGEADMEIDSDDKEKSHANGEDGGLNGQELSFREKIIEQAQVATKFDIVPTVAIPYASQCHSIAFSEGPRWIITGGEDGFIRKYDFIASIEGKSPLTMAQKHNLVDTVTKAGVIVSYWENEQPQTKQQLLKSNPKLKMSDFAAGTANYEPKLSPVYSLAADRNGYWCLSGLSRGGIALYTMRYNEGSIHHYFMQGRRGESTFLSSGHADTISVLKLNSEENKFLSGSWDKTIREWDLNSGKCSNIFLGLSGQISNIQYRPFGLSDMSLSIYDEDNSNTANGKTIGASQVDNPEAGSDIDSLFGESDEEEDQKQRIKDEAKDKSSPIPVTDSSTLHNKQYANDSIFMSSSIDGTINIWDVRVSDQNGANSVIKLGVPANTPPWCMSSAWSNCGDYIYAGRRNSTVEEFSIKMPHKRAQSSHAKGTMAPNVLKTLNFPKISGPISSISTMPNKDFLLCGSNDNIRLYNLSLYNGVENSNIQTTSKNKPATPFMIIPGHHGGILSALWLDETGRFMVSSSGNRGWGQFNYTETVLLYEIDFE